VSFNEHIKTLFTLVEISIDEQAGPGNLENGFSPRFRAFDAAGDRRDR
jgi:hypothetical protein